MQTTIGVISVICQNHAAAAETVLIKPQIASLAVGAGPFSHRRRQRTAGTASRRTARRSGPAVTLHQSPAVVIYSGDRLRLDVRRDV